jgi:long-chain acyl-CoA synthetase
MNKVKALLGGNVSCMITGSAPIDVEVMNFLKICFGCTIIEAYGLTETAGASNSTIPRDPLAGHVGGPLACVKLRLRDVPEMQYFHTDKPYPRGEVQMYGENITTGYYKRQDKTDEAFDKDGWFCSGDVGMIFPNGSLKLIDRAKNIFKLSQGEYIAPEKLENVFVLSPFIAQVMVYGDSLQNCTVALVVVEVAAMEKWANENGH